jgi:uncharacterized protein
VRSARFAATLVAAALALAGCGSSSPDEPASAAKVRTVSVRVGAAKVQAEVAGDAAARRRGLSGRRRLPDDRGMLFVFPSREPRTFWMKGMRFPLDILWIDRGRVTGIAQDVPVPEGSLPVYPSGGPVDRVLEVSAGWTGRHGVSRGDRVQVGR